MKRVTAFFAIAVLLGLAAGCGGGSDRGDQFVVVFSPDPVGATYDGHYFWWRYEVTGRNASGGDLHLAGFYIDRGDGRWRWYNGNIPFPAGHAQRVWTEAVRIDPARVQPGATARHLYRFVVMDENGQFEVPASVLMKF